MERTLIFDQDDDEGICFDLERANREGMKEEMSVEMRVQQPGSTVTAITTVKMTDALFDALKETFEFGVNVPPGEVQTVHLVVDYEYVYGKVDPSDT